MTLIDDARQVMRVQRLSLNTEKTYLAWIEQYVRFGRTPAGGAVSPLDWLVAPA